MASVINTNMASLNAQRNLTTSQSSLATSLQRLSSGLRINSAKDDAAGLAISERFNTQIRGMNVAVRNANDGISLAQSAEGAMTEIGNNLQRIRELAVQSRNATNSDSDRTALDAEAQQLKAEIDRVAKQTSFNGTKLLDGSFTSKSFQVGADQGQTIDIAQIANAKTTELGNWTSVATSASITGAVPSPTGATTGTPAAPATSGASGLFTSAVSSADDQNFTFTVGGVEILNSTQAGAPVTIDGAAIDAALTTNTAALTAAGITFTGTAAAGTLNFSKADGTAFTVSLVSDFGTAGSFANGATFVATHSGTPEVPASAGSFNAITAGQFTINGQDILVGAATSASQRASNLVNAINAKTGDTNVTASLDNGKLVLKSSTADITVGFGGALDADGLLEATGLTAGVSGAAAGGTAWAAGKTEKGFADLDISTTEGADNAIRAMDAALSTLNSARADMGAVQNRFTSVVNSLQTTSENLTASRSRILDTDFAAETANLTRGQILQQAGTAMLAQANSLPNGVLALLRG